MAGVLSPLACVIERVIFHINIDLPFIPDGIKWTIFLYSFVSFLCLPWFCAFSLRTNDRPLKLIALFSCFSFIFMGLAFPEVE
jgi:hypothetical protein